MGDSPFLPCHGLGRNSDRHIPLVFKSGSSCSPNVISPQAEDDFFLAGGGVDPASDILPIVPPAHFSTALPLFSPSEQDVQQPISRGAPFPTSSAFADANPVNFSLPTPPDSEPRRLRLPPFDMLGIAALHPDDLSHPTSKSVTEPFGGTLLPWQGAGDELGSPFDLRRLEAHNQLPSPFDSRQGLQHPYDMITPPDEEPNFRWRPPLIRAASFTAASKPSVLPPLPADICEATDFGGALPDQGIPQGSEESGCWLDGAIRAVGSNLDFNTIIGRSLRVLSHALPSPSQQGHAFPEIIDKIHNASPSSSLTWINLLHAVPGRFNLADLPTSPPATPGLPLGGGDDYFTTKIFESAVTAVNYEEGLTPLPTQHHPLAAPSSINLSIVERYIPPTSPNEFANLFNIKAPSLLVDRLVELTPGNGCLVFIYPTKAGATTFARDYLGPILDPLLRAMVVINNFSADLSVSLGRMMAVDRLLDFDIMRRRSVTLCDELNANGPNARQRLHGTRGDFSLVYASKQHVTLDRDVWADWWIKQEKPRVRTAVAKYFRMVHRLPADVEIMPTNLVEQVLNGVASRQYEQAPTTKIEVGVFVVRRSACAA